MSLKHLEIMSDEIEEPEEIMSDEIEEPEEIMSEEIEESEEIMPEEVEEIMPEEIEESEEIMPEEIEEPAEIKTPRHKLSVLDLFKNITSENEIQQTKTQINLLKHLTTNNCTQDDITYTLNRFVKGLGAQNNKSKIGFYTVLSTFIKTLSITGDDLLGAIKKELKSSAKNTRSENADISCGQVLAVGASIRSGLIQEESAETKKKLIQILITAGNKRDYLMASSYSFIVELLDKLTSKEFKSIVVPIIKEQNTKVKCLDTLYLMLAIHKKLPKVKLFNISQVDKGNIKEICQMLMNPPKLSFQNHPVYKLICELMVAKSPELIASFTCEIDSYLQVDKSSFNKISIALVILTHLAANVENSEHFPEILQKNAIQQILSYCNQTRGQPKDTLKQLINSFLDKIAQNLNKDSSKVEHKLDVLKQLWFNPGSLDFERIVASKVIQQIIASLNIDGVQILSDLLVEIIKGEVASELRHINNNQRVYAAQLLVKLISHPKANEAISWKAEKLIILADVSIFVSPEISNELAGLLREVFYRALDIKLPKLADLRNVLSQLVHHINKKLYKDLDQPRVVIGRTEGELWAETLKRIDIFEKQKEQTPLTQVFLTLFLNIILQIYREESISESTLRELFCCYDRASGNKTEEDMEWIQVVVDLFLNLLSQNSHLLRSLIGCVFPHLCSHLNRDAVHQILAVFEPDNDIDTLLGEDGDSDSDSDENDELKDGEESELDDIDVDKSDDSETGMNTDEDEGDETVNDRLRDALSNVLRTQSGTQSDEESIDIDHMDEEAASKLDTALANAFKQFRPKTGKQSKKQSKVDQILTHFRVRVLDLIEIYIDTSPPMKLVLEIMLPLLQSLQFSIRDVHQKPLLQRISHCLKRLGSLKKFANTDGVTQQVLHDLLVSLLEKGSKSALMMQDMSMQLTECCLFVLRCSVYLVANGEGKAQTKNKALKNLVVNELRKFLVQRDCLTPLIFFRSILSMVWPGNISIAAELIDRIFDDEVRPFKRSQALEMLRIFYSNHRLLTGCTDKEKITLRALEKNIMDQAAEILSAAEGVKLKDKFVTNLFLALQNIYKCPLESEVAEWKSLGEIIREYRSGVSLSKESKAAYNKLCATLGINQNVSMKKSTITLEAEQKEIVNGVQKTKTKAKGHNKERKEKKASRMLRMQSLSEGLEELMPFSTATETNLDSAETNYRNISSNNQGKSKLKKAKKRTKSESTLNDVAIEVASDINGAVKKKKSKKK